MMKFIFIISVSPVPVNPIVREGTTEQNKNGPEGPFFAVSIRRSGAVSYP
jgi:hypothetical protein